MFVVNKEKTKAYDCVGIEIELNNESELYEIIVIFANGRTHVVGIYSDEESARLAFLNLLN